jgi:hypothetical protein
MLLACSYVVLLCYLSWIEYIFVIGDHRVVDLYLCVCQHSVTFISGFENLPV